MDENTIPAGPFSENEIKLLKYEIEEHVKKRLIQIVGIPLGLGGILGILLVAFFIIPSYIDKIFNDNPVIKAAMKTQIENTFVETINSVVGHAVVENAVIAYLKNDDSQAMMKKEVENFLSSKDGNNKIAEAIDKALQPALDKLSSTISKNTNSHIDLATIDLSLHTKGGIYDLEQMNYSSQEVRDIIHSGKPVALTVNLWTEPLVFDSQIFIDYISRMKSLFGDKFNMILFKDKDDEIFGYTNAIFMKNRLKDDPEAVIGCLNELVFDENFEESCGESEAMDFICHSLIVDRKNRTRSKLKKIFSENYDVVLYNDMKISEALTNHVWTVKDINSTYIPVLGTANQLIGITTRKLLIDSLIENNS